jgi:hypothetical protein
MVAVTNGRICDTKHFQMNSRSISFINANLLYYEIRSDV